MTLQLASPRIALSQVKLSCARTRPPSTWQALRASISDAALAEDSAAAARLAAVGRQLDALAGSLQELEGKRASLQVCSSAVYWLVGWLAGWLICLNGWLDEPATLHHCCRLCRRLRRCCRMLKCLSIFPPARRLFYFLTPGGAVPALPLSTGGGERAPERHLRPPDGRSRRRVLQVGVAVLQAGVRLYCRGCGCITSGVGSRLRSSGAEAGCQWTAAGRKDHCTDCSLAALAPLCPLCSYTEDRLAAFTDGVSFHVR